MFWVYGMVPHLWLTWADNELKWRPDKLARTGPGGVLKPQKAGGWFPMTLNYAGRSATSSPSRIYVVFLGRQHVRCGPGGRTAASGPTTSARPSSTSDYGRPLVRKS